MKSLFKENLNLEDLQKIHIKAANSSSAIEEEKKFKAILDFRNNIRENLEAFKSRQGLATFLSDEDMTDVPVKKIENGNLDLDIGNHFTYRQIGNMHHLEEYDAENRLFYKIDYDEANGQETIKSYYYEHPESLQFEFKSYRNPDLNEFKHYAINGDVLESYSKDHPFTFSQYLEFYHLV